MQVDPMAALLGGGGAGAAAAGPPQSIPLPGGDAGAGAVPPGGGGGVPGQPDNPDSEQALADAIDAIHRFIQSEEDEADKNIGAKILALATSITAGRQKETEAAQGITPVHKAVGRAVKKAHKAGGGGY